MRRSKPYIDDEPEPSVKKIGLPTLSSDQLLCNRCGECCKVGGECELRRIHPIATTEFDGRCEFLTDLADGTTQCERMVGIVPNAPWFKRLVDGNCDFPEMRVEVG